MNELPKGACETLQFEDFTAGAKRSSSGRGLTNSDHLISPRGNVQTMPPHVNASVRGADFARDPCLKEICRGAARAFAASTGALRREGEQSERQPRPDADGRARSLTRPLAWFCLLVIAVLSLVPGDLRPHSFLPGRAEHFVAYAVAGWLLALGYWSTRARVLGWLSVSIASGAFEILQNFVPQRTPSVWDALVSVGGLTFGILLGAFRYRNRRRGRESDVDL